MIASLTGTVQQLEEAWMILNVNGVGYEVLVTEAVRAQLASSSGEVTVFTYTHVREEIFALYGFLSLEERALFVELLKISGVGPKAALSVLSQGPPSQLASAVLAEDVAYFSGAAGIGKKTAERLLMELSGVVERFASSTIGVQGGAASGSVVTSSDASSLDEAIEALVQLGYKQKEAEQAIRQAASQVESPTTEALVRAALAGVMAA